MSTFDLASIAALMLQWAIAGIALAFVTGRHEVIDMSWKRWAWILYLGMAAGGVVLFALAPIASEGGRSVLNWVRGMVGAFILAAVTNVGILGRWYLRRAGLDRVAIIETVQIALVLTAVSTVLAFIAPGMLSVLNGSTDDGFGGLLGWFWLASLATMIALLVMVDRALHEPYDGAVMTATGISYLVVLTAMGVDLIPRLVLAGQP